MLLYGELRIKPYCGSSLHIVKSEMCGCNYSYFYLACPLKWISVSLNNVVSKILYNVIIFFINSFYKKKKVDLDVLWVIYTLLLI